jgi:hypothetical protein
MGRIAAGMMRNQKDGRSCEMGGMETKKWARINNEMKDAEGSRKGWSIGYTIWFYGGCNDEGSAVRETWEKMGASLGR